MGDESSKERLDREFIELLTELRVLLPGVQVLFAFLLTVPFNTGFLNASTFHRLLSAGGSSDDGVGDRVARRPCRATPHPVPCPGKAAPAVAVEPLRDQRCAAAGRRGVVSVLLVVDYLFQILVASICAGLVAAARVGVAGPTRHPARSVPARRAVRSRTAGTLVSAVWPISQTAASVDGARGDSRAPPEGPCPR
jgi:hypothetical protein